MHRAAIFVHWDKNNIIDDYVVYYVQELHNVAQDIYFISNSQLSQQEFKKVTSFTKEARCRNNIGLDFGAWKEILENIGFNALADTYDEVILANDSCYGPLFPFSEMFNAMEKRLCDFWGVTKNLNPAHIQSYFYVLRESALRSQAFRDFFMNFNYGYTREETILKGEMIFTELLCRASLCYEVYADYHQHDVKNLHRRVGASDVFDMTIYYWPELIKRHMPLLKVKALPKDVELFSGSIHFYLKKLKAVLVKQKSNYDCQLIYKHQKRVYPALSQSGGLIKSIKNWMFFFLKAIKRKFL